MEIPLCQLVLRRVFFLERSCPRTLLFLRCGCLSLRRPYRLFLRRQDHRSFFRKSPPPPFGCGMKYRSSFSGPWDSALHSGLPYLAEPEELPVAVLQVILQVSRRLYLRAHTGAGGVCSSYSGVAPCSSRDAWKRGSWEARPAWRIRPRKDPLPAGQSISRTPLQDQLHCHQKVRVLQIVPESSSWNNAVPTWLPVLLQWLSAKVCAPFRVKALSPAL